MLRNFQNHLRLKYVKIIMTMEKLGRGYDRGME